MKKTLLFFVFSALLNTVCSQAQTPYVVWCEGDNTLYFTCRTEDITVGSMFTPDGKSYKVSVTEVSKNLHVTDTPKMYDNSNPDWQYYVNKDICWFVVIEESFKKVKPRSFRSWFLGFSNALFSGIENLDTSEATSMSFMFQGCMFSELDLRHFNTSKVTDMRGMFSACNFVSIDLSSFDTSQVTDMYYMFAYCGASSLDLSSFDTSKVTDMAHMFLLCDNLERIFVSDLWSTENVTSSGNMFVADKLVGEDGTTVATALINEKRVAHFGAGGLMTSNFLPTNTKTWDKLQLLRKHRAMTFKLKGRTLKGGHWNTLCIPSDMPTLEGTPLAGAQVLVASGYENDGEHVALKFKESPAGSVIVSGAPYLVKPTKDLVKPTFHLSLGENAPSSVGFGTIGLSANNYFTGVYTQQILPASRETLCLKDDMFSYTTTETTVDAFSAYYVLTALVPPEATAIGITIDTSDDVEVEQCATPTITFLNGRAVFSCETEGVSYKANSLFIKTSSTEVSGNEMPLPTTFTIEVNVIAKKEGFRDSAPAIATFDVNTHQQGDVNGDGKVDVSDVLSTVKIALGN